MPYVKNIGLAQFPKTCVGLKLVIITGTWSIIGLDIEHWSLVFGYPLLKSLP